MRTGGRSTGFGIYFENKTSRTNRLEGMSGGGLKEESRGLPGSP
jgi:hypothetical protein